ncbi:Structural maintenance of chromosomes protein [Aphelenchoides besseyi]|nr:Structural maintenance of chromosomes protein [Aphelenchoides besseyi]
MSKELMDALKLREEWQRKVEVQNYELKLLKESVYKKREMLRNLERKSTDLQEQNRAIKNLKKNLAASSQMLSRKKFENLKSNSEWVQKLSAEKKRLEVIRGVVEQKKKDIEVAKKQYAESEMEERSKWELNKWIVTMVSDAMERKRMLKKLAALLVKKAAKKYAEKIDASNELMEIDNLENRAQTDSPIKQPTSQQPTENQQKTNADNEAEQMSDEEPPTKQSRVTRSEKKKTKSEHQKRTEQLQSIQEVQTENANEEEMNVQNVEEEHRPEEETEASSGNVVNIRIDEDEEEEDERNESPIGNFFNDFSTPSRSNDNNDSIDFIFGTPSDAQTPPNPKPKTPKRTLPATSMRSENPRTESCSKMPPTRRRNEMVERIVTPAPEEDEEVAGESEINRQNVIHEDLLNMHIPDRPVPIMSTDPHKDRLIITHIVVENFKSYYGRRTLGPFHKGSEYTVKPGSQFHVSRSVTKSGSSTYHINGKTVHTNEGEVEQIALMKPKSDDRHGEEGMLEYLEDIIGSSRLKEPIAKLKKKLDWFNDEEDMVRKRLDLAESEVSQMAGAVLDVLKMMKVENAITEFELDERYKAASNELDSANVSQNEAKEELHKCERELRKENKQKADSVKEIDKLEEKIQDAEQNNRKCELNARKTNEKIKLLRKKIETKEAEIEQDSEKLEDARAAPAKAEETLKTQGEIIERCQQEIRECEDQLRDLRAKERTANANNRQKLEEIMPKIIDLNSEEDKCTSNLNVAKDKLERLQKVGSTVEARYTAAENSYKNLEGELSKTTRFVLVICIQTIVFSDLEKIRSRIPEVKTEIENLETEHRNNRGTEHELANEVNDLHREIEQHRHRADGYRTNNATLAALTQEKQNGNIPGIYGRLGDLGAIDEKYDVAISTCCRPLDDVLVDTVETAQDCIKFLKERNLPRITFIVLEKQNHFWSKIKNKPQTGRMGNQVRAESQESSRNWSEMENQLKHKQEQLNRLRSALSQKMETLKAKKEELAQLEHRQRLLKQQMMASKKESVNQRASVLRTSKEKLEEEIKKVEEKILGAAQSRLKTSKATLKTAEETQNKANLTLKNVDSVIKRFELGISKAKRTIEDTEREIEQATTKLQEQNEIAQQEAGKKDEYEERVATLKTLLVEKTELINTLTTQEEQLKHQIQDRQRELNEMSKKVESLLAKMNNMGKLSILHIRQDILPFLTEQIQNQTVVPNPNETATTATTADEDNQADEEEDLEAELPNTTAVTGIEGNVSLDPPCDTTGLPSYTEEQIQAFVKEELENRHRKLEAKKKKFKGQMNLQLVEDFGEKMDRRIQVSGQMKELLDSKQAHRRVLRSFVSNAK